MKSRRPLRLLLVLAIAVQLTASEHRAREPGTRSESAGIYGVVLTNFYSYSGEARRPAAKVPVYLFTLEASAALTRLQQQGYEDAHRPGLSEREAGFIARKYYDSALDEALRLRGLATGVANTDKNGVYRFPLVKPGKAYKVVALKIFEDDAIFAVRTTPGLKCGQTLRLDLNDQDPWWETPEAWVHK